MRLFAVAVILGAGAAAAEEPLAFEIQLDVAHQDLNDTFCWFHPRCAAIPDAGTDGNPAVIMTLQKAFMSASDYFSGLSVLRTDDMSQSWQGPEERPEWGWRDAGDGVTIGVCDVTPGWHNATGKLLAPGHTVMYKNEKLYPDPRPRSTGYSVFDPKDGSWKPWEMLELPDEPEYFSAGSGCTQWLEEPDGTILLPMYFKAKSKNGKATYAATVMRCTFDGETLRFVKRGNVLRNEVPRGYCEPSLTFYGGKYYLTLRNDVRAYVSVSEDGLHFDEPTPWVFDDGKELGSYNTQAHWVTHSDGLFLSYTRRGANNDHIMRNRAPLFIGQVDPDRRCVVRATERVLVPERGAQLGNFGASTISATESWVTVGEGMYRNAAKHGAEGCVFVARVIWSKPNRLLDRLR